MMPETVGIRWPKVRTDTIVKRLSKAYPARATPQRYKDPFRILITTILAAQCTDDRAAKVASYLFKRYKNVRGFSRAKQDILEKEVYSAGFYRNKAKNIITASIKIAEDYNGVVPDAMAELLNLPGVGRKTANIILSNAFHRAEGIAVDTHTRRISKRLGLTYQNEPERIEQDLMKIVRRRYWRDFNYLLVRHGKKICKSRNPLCYICAIGSLCPSKRCSL